MKSDERLLAHRVPVGLGARSYDVLVGCGLLDQAAAFAPAGRTGSAMLVTNAVVAPLLGERVERTLRQCFGSVHSLVLPDGEAHKTWSTLNLVFDALLEARCDRNSTLVALGGGVVGDIAGFAAACYMRGIDCIQVPTTLLAQVDSAVGGKTGINHPAGKNMIGAIHQPRRVVADVDALSTLPKRELIAGLAEVIKYGIAADSTFLGWIEANLDALKSRDAAAVSYAVRRCCEIKAAIVAEDERESGRRAILNFGHTFGHAIEAGTGYGTWLHGEAVGCGMAMAADLSWRMGRIDSALAARIQALVERTGLSVRAPALGNERYMDLMRHDKKSSGGEIRFVVLDAIGSASLAVADAAAVNATLSAFAR